MIITRHQYWRRHKHEIEVKGTGDGDGEDDEPAAPSGSGGKGVASVTALQVPRVDNSLAKRQRYSQQDDILLARFWATSPKGTSDKIFQAFAKEVRTPPYWTFEQKRINLTDFCFH